MTPAEFVAKLKTHLIDENLSIYEQLLSTTQVEDATDEHWKQSLVLFNALTTDQQHSFLIFIRQVMIDTTSTFLGTIDGVCHIAGAHEDFELTYGESGDALSGDLQSLFLASEESQPPR